MIETNFDAIFKRQVTLTKAIKEREKEYYRLHAEYIRLQHELERLSRLQATNLAAYQNTNREMNNWARRYRNERFPIRPNQPNEQRITLNDIKARLKFRPKGWATKSVIVKPNNVVKPGSPSRKRPRNFKPVGNLGTPWWGVN
jgi:hypothetical protein